MGCYVFSRLDDMFEFFRTDREYAKRKGKTLEINLGYWSEKLQAVDGSHSNGSAKEFNEDEFQRIVKEQLVGWIRRKADQTTKEERRELWDAVLYNVLEADGDGDGYRKQSAAYDFSHDVNATVGEFYFQELWDYDFTEYTHRFVWCCYALAWGIAAYDQREQVLEMVVKP